MEAKSERFLLNIVSPERLVYSEEVEMVVIPGKVGDFGVLPRHEALVSLLRPGLIEVFENHVPIEHIFVGGGFAEVADDVCSVLAEEVMPISELNGDDLEKTIQEMRENMSSAQTHEERSNLEVNLYVANAKLEIVKRLLKK